MKHFLKSGDAESYHDVEVKYIFGSKATLTIYDENGVEIEKVLLSPITTNKELHQLFREKGFQLKSKEEIEALKKRRQLEFEQEEKRKETVQKQKLERIKQQEQNQEFINDVLGGVDTIGLKKSTIAKYEKLRQKEGGDCVGEDCDKRYVHSKYTKEEQAEKIRQLKERMYGGRNRQQQEQAAGSGGAVAGSVSSAS